MVLEEVSLCSCLEGQPLLDGWSSHTPVLFGWVEQGMPCSTALAVAVLQVACKALQLAPQGLSICFTVPLITTIYLLLQHTNRAAIYQVYTGHEIIEHRCAENWKGKKELFVKSPDFYKYTNFPGGNLVSTTCCMQAAMYPWDIGDLSPFMLATKNLF